MGPRLRWPLVVKRHSHNIVMACLVLFVCAGSGWAFWLSFQQVAEIYLEAAERSTVELQESFLKVNVENLLREIEYLRREEEQRWADLVNDRLYLLRAAQNLAMPDFPTFFQAVIEGVPGLTGVLCNLSSGELVYGSLGRLDNPAERLASYEVLLFGDFFALWGVEKRVIEERVKNQLQVKLPNWDLGSGIWLEISQSLQADPQSGSGLSWSDYYDAFDWVITMGVDQSELERHAAQTEDVAGKLAVLLSLRLVLILVLVVVAAVGLVLAAEYLFFRRYTARLELEVREDLLTGAKSRRSGVETLTDAFNQFVSGAKSPVLFMFDVDGLKEINDTFGHAAGDQVLQAVARAVRRTIGSHGELIRWGGDEFVVIASPEQGNRLEDRILRAVSALEFSFAEQKVKTSISLGAAQFQMGDENYLAALERADQILYEVKRASKEAAPTD